MSCWTKEQLENMLEDVVNELDLSENMIEKHGPLGTPPAELVKAVLEQKNLEIRLLKQGFQKIETFKPKVDVEEIEQIVFDGLVLEGTEWLIRIPNTMPRNIAQAIASHINEGRGGENVVECSTIEKVLSIHNASDKAKLSMIQGFINARNQSPTD